VNKIVDYELDIEKGSENSILSALPQRVNLIENTVTIMALEGSDGIMMNSSNINIKVNLTQKAQCRYSTRKEEYNRMDVMVCEERNQITTCTAPAGLGEGINTFFIECRNDEGGESGTSVQHIKCGDIKEINRNVNTQSYIYTISTAPPFDITNTEPMGMIEEKDAWLKATTTPAEEVKCSFKESLQENPTTMRKTEDNQYGFELTGMSEGKRRFFVTCKDSYGTEKTRIVDFEVVLG
jgi:hypothetical protein